MSEVLLAAVRDNDFEEVVLRLEAGANVNYQNNEGLSALHEAVLNLNIEMITYLLDRGAQIDQEDEGGLTPLNHSYDEYNHDNEAPLLPIINVLLNAGANPDHAPNGTLVCWAAFNGFQGIVNRLILADADLTDAEDEALDGGHPHLAALIRNAQSITNVEASSTDDETPHFGFGYH